MAATQPQFAELLERFFYRPDEAVGWFLEGTPESSSGTELAPDESTEEFLSFVLEGETYAVPIGGVREILKVTHVTEVPRAGENLIGLINVRGEMLPLYDVKVRLRLASGAPWVRTAADVGRSTRIVLFKDIEGDAGILVDRVEGVVKLQRSHLEEMPELGVDRSCIAGLGRRDGQMLILLDVERVLA